MTYEELEIRLQNNHFYPAKSYRVKNKTKIFEGFQIDSPPILRESRGEKIREIIGDEFTATWMGNGEANNHFLIKKK